MQQPSLTMKILSKQAMIGEAYGPDKQRERASKCVPRGPQQRKLTRRPISAPDPSVSPLHCVSGPQSSGGRAAKAAADGMYIGTETFRPPFYSLPVSILTPSACGAPVQLAVSADLASFPIATDNNGVSRKPNLPLNSSNHFLGR